MQTTRALGAARRVQRIHADAVSMHTFTAFFLLTLSLLPSNLLTWLRSHFRSCSRPETSVKASLSTGPCHSAFLTFERNTCSVTFPALILARLFPVQRKPLLRGKRSTKPKGRTFRVAQTGRICIIRPVPRLHSPNFFLSQVDTRIYEPMCVCIRNQNHVSGARH